MPPVSDIARPRRADINESPLPAAQGGDPVARMAELFELLQPALLAYLQENSSYQESYDGAPAEELLSASPIAQLIADDEVTDILINGPREIYINRNNQLERTDITFPDNRSLRRLARAIAGSVGRSIDPRRPLVDARLRDGSRVNIIFPPMSVDGVSISIRKFPKQELTLESLEEKGELTKQMAEFLKFCAECRISLLISGGTGTGKTTLLNAISRFIPTTERIITIEDTAELRLQQPHVVRLETKEPSVINERREEVNASDLVRNCLRMRPDRIIVGEVRGPEAYDMIQALNTGHDGSMTTVHANTARDAFTRIENLTGLRMQNTPAGSIRRQIVSAFGFIVQIAYNAEGKRVISNITEIVGMEGETPTMQDIFTLREEPGVPGRQVWTGIIPHHPRLAEAMRACPLFVAQPG